MKKIITILIISLLFVGCVPMPTSTVEEQKEEIKPTAEVEKTTEQQMEDQEGNKTEVPEKEPETPESDNEIKAGMYKVGTDIPAGEYKLFADGGFGSYVEVATDSSGALESIVFNEMFTTFTYITVNDGEYVKLQGCYAIPISEIEPYEGEYKDGMYRVGIDIPAGEYKISTDNMGYIEVSTDSRHTLGSIISNQNIQADVYQTVNEGEYLKLQGCYIVE